MSRKFSSETRGSVHTEFTRNSHNITARLQSSSTMSQLPAKFIDGAKKLKVKELTPYARKFASEELTTTKLSGRYNTWMQNYKKQYIDKGSPKPFFDVVAILFFGSYALAWPQELKHLRAEEAAKLEGKSGHH